MVSIGPCDNCPPLFIFFILFPIQNKPYFILSFFLWWGGDDIFGNRDTKWRLNMALIVQTILGIFFCQIRFSAILSLKEKNKKVPMTTKHEEEEGGGKALEGH